MFFLIPLSLIRLGLGFCWYGYPRWKGKIHWSYIDFGYFQEGIYMAIPLGITCILLGIALFFPKKFVPVLIFVAIFVAVLGILYSRQLFKPEWLKRVEKNHKEVKPYLHIEIRDHGNWPVETQEDLEVWIAELRHKYGM